MIFRAIGTACVLLTLVGVEGARQARHRVSRAGFLARTAALVSSSAPLLIPSLVLGDSKLPAQKAVGTRRDGIDLDASLGITWGGRRRCDAREVGCAADGGSAEMPKLAVPAGGGRPELPGICEVQLEVAGEERSLRFKLFEDAPSALTGDVQALLSNSLRRNGFTTSLAFGSVLQISRGRNVVLGTRSQSEAFARRKGLRKAPEDFEPFLGSAADSTPVTPADAAGLVGVRRTGLGEHLEISFTTASSAKAVEDFVVVGRVVDEESMETLSRLDITPVQRSLKNGQPLVKTAISRTAVRSEAP